MQDGFAVLGPVITARLLRALCMALAVLDVCIRAPGHAFVGSCHRVVIVDTDKPSIIYTDDDVVQVDEAQAGSAFLGACVACVGMPPAGASSS